MAKTNSKHSGKCLKIKRDEGLASKALPLEKVVRKRLLEKLAFQSDTKEWTVGRIPKRTETRPATEGAEGKAKRQERAERKRENEEPEHSEEDVFIS